MRRASWFVAYLGVVLLAAGCSGSSPAAPSPVPSSALEAKSEKPLNVNGAISDLSGTPAAFQFVVGTVQVRGDEGSEFFGESLFAHLGNGIQVEVKGEQRVDHVYARRLHVNSRVIQPPPPAGGATGPGDGGGEEPPPPPPPPPCSWASTGPTAPDTTAPRFGEIYISTMTGAEPALMLTMLDGRSIRTSDSTVVRRNSDLLPLGILRPRLIVEVFGTWASTTLFDAAEIRLTRDTLDVNAEGPAAGVTGGYPEAQFTIGTTPFVANDWTKFPGSPCDALIEGAALRVRGIRMIDGVTVLATYVEQVPE